MHLSLFGVEYIWLENLDECAACTRSTLSNSRMHIIFLSYRIVITVSLSFSLCFSYRMFQYFLLRLLVGSYHDLIKYLQNALSIFSRFSRRGTVSCKSISRWRRWELSISRRNANCDREQHRIIDVCVWTRGGKLC